MAFLSQATTSCGLVSLSWGLSGACCSHHRVVYDASLQRLIGCLYTQGVSTFFHAASRRTQRSAIAIYPVAHIQERELGQLSQPDKPTNFFAIQRTKYLQVNPFWLHSIL